MTSSENGKGRLGCLVTILLSAAVIYVGIKVGPPYYNAKEFEGQLRNEGIKAVTRSYPDEAIVKDVISLAKGYEINLKPENIKVKRFGDRVDINVDFDLPIEFEVINYTYTWHFTATSQSRSVL